MSLLQQLLDNNEVYLYADYRSGTFKDYSGNQTPTNDGGVLKNKKAMFNFNTTCAYGVIPIGTNDFSIIVKQKPYQYNALAIHSNTGDTYTSFNVTNYSSGGLSLYIDAAYYNVTGTGADIGKDNIMGWSCDRDGNARIFYNGLFVGLRDISAKSELDLQINAEINYKTSIRRSDYDYVLIAKRVLTDTEMAQLTAELENKKWTSKTKSSTHPYSSIINGKLNNDDNWILGTDGTSGNNWTIGSGKLVYTSLATTGSPVTAFCPTLSLTAGKTYYLNFDLTLLDISCRFSIVEGAGGITIVDYDTYTNGGRLSLPFTSSGLDQIRIIASQVSKSFEISNITLTEVPEVIYKTESGIKADQKSSIAGNKLSNSDFIASDTTFKVSDDTFNGEDVKALEYTHAASGDYVYIPTNNFKQTPNESAYGEWRFCFKKSASNCTVRAGIIQSEIGTPNSGTNNGYYVYVGASTSLTLVRVDSGTPTTILTGTAITDTEYHEIKLTRSITGVFELFVDNVSQGTYTDNTYTTSNYMVFNPEGASSKIILSSEKGTYGIIKK